MTRRNDLEKLIRESYGFILEYERIWQLSPDPREKARCQTEIDGQWGLIRGWLREYQRVAPANWPQDLEQVAARFADEGAGAAEPSVALERQVFFAYSRQDQDFALRLAAELKRRGVPLWVDQWDILAGADWDQAIDDAVYACGHFLIVLSPAAVTSREVRGELRIALKEDKPVVSVLYQDCRLPRQLELIQYVDYTA